MAIRAARAGLLELAFLRSSPLTIAELRALPARHRSLGLPDTEQRHQPVPELLGDFPAHFRDGFRCRVETRPDQITPFLGIELCGYARRIHEIAEHHGEVAALASDIGRSGRRRRRCGRQPEEPKMQPMPCAEPVTAPR